MSTNILPPPPFGTHYEATDADTANTAGAGSGSVISYGTHPGQALLPPQGTFVVTDVRSHANTPQATTLQGISFIICSIDDSKFRHISQRIGAICLQHHEIIRISDAKGLSEGYTRGIASALHDTLVLCHDDIDLLCEQAFAGILEQGLLQFDVIGVAGPRKLKSGFWLNGGPTNSAGLVIHGPADKHDAPFSINYYDTGPERQIPVEALDGVFIVARRQVFDTVRFDASLFDGFHLYDIDFTYRCHLAGFRLGVCKDLLLVHSSAGNFGGDWLRYEARFHRKFPQLATARLSPRYSPAAIQTTSRSEALALCRNPDHGLRTGPDADRNLPTTAEPQPYEIWRKRSTMQEIDAQILAERMVLTWKTRPGIHLLMTLHPGEESLLADTLDSLACQLYPEWMLTVVTALPPPDGATDIPNLQWLALREDTHLDYVVDEMAAASPGTWLARIPPGLSFEPQSLQVIADYINARPGWRLIYSDEDTREADGSYTTPLFKPDFNLDLLRSISYFGSLMLVAKDAFLATGRYGTLAGAENYDLALRIIDSHTPDQIGHISQMLAHLPRESSRAMNPSAEKEALRAHLLRNGLDADVEDGLLFGTRQVRYRWPDSPLVSIIIQTRDREEYLRPLLDSLFARTRYSAYEVIIVDNDSTDPDVLTYFTSLLDENRARVIRQPGGFNYAAGANAGAAAAQGDYLLFLDNDTHVVQDDWLTRMMAQAQRPDVGIVGPRLAYPESARLQHAPWVLGVRGTAGTPWDGELELTGAGYMGRALCDQEASAVSGSALLVRRSAFESAGGLDAEHLDFLNANIDLCLRMRHLGLRTIWTPGTTLVHYGGVSIKAHQRLPADALTDVIAARENHNTLIHRWLPQLANDPFYNRNLSLVELFKPEHVAPIDWDGNFHDRPRILGIPLTGGAGEYRLRAPLRAISQAGLAQTMIVEPPKAFFVRILTPVEVARAAPDTLILHQPLDDAQTDALESYARFNTGVKRIITIDDLITALPPKNSFFKNSFKDARPRLRRTLSLADRVIVSTQPLADICADMIGDIRIMPNCLESSLWGDVVPPRLPRKKPRVGWAGAQQHLGDLELIYTVVEALADEVDWIFMGMCPEPLKPFVRESHGFVQDFRLYPQALARLDLDLAIAPLEIHAFNECKSNLRLLEYGAMGWPVVCTDIYPYQNAPVTRLPNDPQKWISTLREQLAEPDALREAGLALQRWVADGFILENHAASWFAAYGP
jgi:GT2 family glycosyltransferase